MRSNCTGNKRNCRPAVRLSGGFSLIEILVVIAIIAVIAGLAALSIGDDPRRSVRNETQRLHALLMQSKEEAILQGQLYLLQMEENRYQFMQPGDKGKLQAVEGDIFRPRTFDDNVVIKESEIDGRDTGKTPAIIIYPSGEMSVFRIVLGNNSSRWQLTGTGDGSVETGLIDDEI